MNAATVFGLCAAVAVGLGLYGLITNPQPLRKILAFNLLGSGVFMIFGVIARGPTSCATHRNAASSTERSCKAASALSRAAGSKATRTAAASRASAICDQRGSAYAASPTIGQPRAARCTRI